MSNLIDHFESVALENFKFLETDYSFRLHDQKKNNYGCCIMYLKDAVGVRVSLEIYDGGVFVYFYKVTDGKVPEYPLFFDEKSELRVFDFNNLYQLRTGRILSQKSNRLYEQKYLEDIVAAFAEAVKNYSDDFLNGDFRFLPQIKEIVARRAGGTGCV